MLEVIDPVHTALIVGAAILFVGYTVYYRRHGSKFLDADRDSTGLDEDDTPQLGPGILETDQLRDKGVDEHLEIIETLDEVQSSLEQIFRRAGGGFGTLLNLGNILSSPLIGSSNRGSRREELLIETSQDHIRALRQLSEGLDRHSELADQIEVPDRDKTVEEMLLESFDTSESLSTGLRARFEQAMLPREIKRDIERIETARHAVAADIRDRT